MAHGAQFAGKHVDQFLEMLAVWIEKHAVFVQEYADVVEVVEAVSVLVVDGACVVWLVYVDGERDLRHVEHCGELVHLRRGRHPRFGFPHAVDALQHLRARCRTSEHLL